MKENATNLCYHQLNRENQTNIAFDILLHHWKHMDTNAYGFFTFRYEEETKFVEDFAESRPWPSFTQDIAKPHGCHQQPPQATSKWITLSLSLSLSLKGFSLFWFSFDVCFIEIVCDFVCLESRLWRSHISTSPPFCYLKNFDGYLEKRWFWFAFTHFDLGSFKSCCLLVCLRVDLEVFSLWYLWIWWKGSASCWEIDEGICLIEILCISLEIYVMRNTG